MEALNYHIDEVQKQLLKAQLDQDGIWLCMKEVPWHGWMQLQGTELNNLFPSCIFVKLFSLLNFLKFATQKTGNIQSALSHSWIFLSEATSNSILTKLITPQPPSFLL